MAFSLKGKNILVYDYGLFIEHCLALAKDGAHIWYFTPWSTAFSQFEAYAPGLGYDTEGIEKILYFWDYVDKADFIFSPDVGPGDMTEYLRKTTKIPVFGTALTDQGGDRLEQERFYMRGIQKEIGLPVQETTRITGITRLREYLQKHENKYVKLDKFRSDMESFQAKNYEEIELYLNEIEVALGPFSETYKFVVEDFIEGIEPGFDCFFNGKEWLKPYLWGIEQSKACYIGKFVNTLPTPLQRVADALVPVLRKMDYRGALSTEVRVTKDGTPYLIDICSRFPAPLSAVYPLAMKNYSEIIWKTGTGEPVTIQNTGTYVSAVPLGTAHAKDHYVKLDFPQNMRDHIKLRVSAKVQDKYYGVKGTEVVFVIVDAGNDYHTLIDNSEQLAKKCDSFGIDYDPLGGLHRIDENIKKYEAYGMGAF